VRNPGRVSHTGHFGENYFGIREGLMDLRSGQRKSISQVSTHSPVSTNMADIATNNGSGSMDQHKALTTPTSEQKPSSNTDPNPLDTNIDSSTTGANGMCSTSNFPMDPPPIYDSIDNQDPALTKEKTNILTTPAQELVSSETLDQINIALKALTKSFEDFKTTTTTSDEIKKDLNKLREDINSDFKASKSEYDVKLADLETKLTADQDSKFNELIDIIGTNKEEAKDVITEVKNTVERGDHSIADLTNTVAEQASKLEHLEATIAELKDYLGKHIGTNNERIIRLQEGVDEARLLANSVEAHGRRWAVRILGLPAPNKFEKSDITKEIVLSFIHNKLNIPNVTLSDIDCAHRLGPVKDKKQSILNRVF
jgi:uncharacterized coiled-coil protein SlyX